MRSALLAILVGMAVTCSAAEPKREAEVHLTPGAQARPGLYEEMLKADAEFFAAFFDTCDIATVRRYVTDDFEMFHDKGGRVSTSGANFVKAARSRKANRIA